MSSRPLLLDCYSACGVIEGDDESVVAAYPTPYHRPKLVDHHPGVGVYAGGQEVILGFGDNFGPAFVVDAPPQRIVQAADIVPRLGLGYFC